jgi:MFS-type transporter involved in bile tolerance (Atg22 family)
MNRLRLGFALAGFVLALVSVVLEDIRLGWAAIAVLLVSAIVRLLLRKRENSNSSTHDRL